MQQELAARRRALAVADLRCEPGLRFWLERQRWLWRQGRLPSEQVGGPGALLVGREGTWLETGSY